MAQVVEHQLSKRKAPSSNSSTTTTKTKKVKQKIILKKPTCICQCFITMYNDEHHDDGTRLPTPQPLPTVEEDRVILPGSTRENGTKGQSKSTST
jgi:hypothetical protein